MDSKSFLFVLSAPSGAGKTTLKDRLMPAIPRLKYSISATTRPQRPGEVDGTHYFFKSRDQFQQMIAQDELIEYNEVHNNFYGTPKAFIDDSLAAGDNIILDLDVYGKINFDKAYPNAIGILIIPPSMELLQQRLIDRKSDDDEVIKIRLQNAVKEMEFAKTKGKYEHTVVNDDLEIATKELQSIVTSYIN
ncbi:MAG: guanylate kinase [Fibrobacteria bacterium]|nr:guanylate kinase [Fibrobacteria bacterium]